MVLSGVGDAMGYRKGQWEFCTSGVAIHKEATQLGGIKSLKIELPGWIISDNTVLHLATPDAYEASSGVLPSPQGKDHLGLREKVTNMMKVGVELENCDFEMYIPSEAVTINPLKHNRKLFCVCRLPAVTGLQAPGMEQQLLKKKDKEQLYRNVAKKFIAAMEDMEYRAPGSTTLGRVRKLKPDEKKGYQTPFNPHGASCGAAMRAMCIGLRYPKPKWN
ncbi:ADPRH [Mytilus coruscus]|uniref:ADPRH n=1 Tax=Mytilus coruscus TaxID=42192 RepID=A0A6J8E4C7_MYTCO|nr:ADPRH [Mytilus coruscus]